MLDVVLLGLLLYYTFYFGVYFGDIWMALYGMAQRRKRRRIVFEGISKM